MQNIMSDTASATSPTWADLVPRGPIESHVGRLLHAIHGTLQSLASKNDQVEEVSDDSEHTNRRRHGLVDDAFHQQMTALR